MKNIVSKIILSLLIVSCLCSCNSKLDNKRTYDLEITKKQYESERLIINEINSLNTKDLCSFSYSYAPDHELDFKLYYESSLDDEVDCLYIKEINTEKVVSIFDAKDYPQKNLNLANIKISLYSYRIIYIYIYDENYNNNFDYWINAKDFLTDEEIVTLQKNRPSIETFGNCNNILFEDTATSSLIELETPLQSKILSELETITENDCSYNVELGPGFSQYATFYMIDTDEKVHTLEICLSGIVFDGVLYVCDNMIYNEVINEITGTDTLF